MDYEEAIYNSVCFCHCILGINVILKHTHLIELFLTAQTEVLTHGLKKKLGKMMVGNRQTNFLELKIIVFQFVEICLTLLWSEVLNTCLVCTDVMMHFNNNA